MNVTVLDFIHKVSAENILYMCVYTDSCLHIYICSFLVALGMCGALVPGPVCIPKCEVTQVPYFKWHSICI